MINAEKLIVILLSFAISNTSFGFSIPNDFSGKWCADKIGAIDGFVILIKKKLNRYQGSYLTVAYNGAKIDDVEDAFSFKVTDKNNLQTKFKSGTSDISGIIQLKILKNNKLKWKIIKIPGGEFYAPRNAILYRCN